MKKQWLIICLALITAGCTSASQGKASEEPEQTAAQETPAAEDNEDNTYVSGMDEYEDMEICFLGTAVSENDEVMETVERAIHEKGIEAASIVTAEDIIYGDVNEEENNIYLIIPAANTDLAIGRFSWYEDGISETWYEKENSSPVIYVEDAHSATPLGMISYLRHTDDSEYSGSMYTGFGLIDSHLRTAFHMGIVDITPYEMFDTSEIPFYGQSFFDRLCSEDETAQKINDGWQLSAMDEFWYEGTMYAIYELAGNNDSVFYGISAEGGEHPFDLIRSDNLNDWYHPYKG